MSYSRSRKFSKKLILKPIDNIHKQEFQSTNIKRLKQWVYEHDTDDYELVLEDILYPSVRRSERNKYSINYALVTDILLIFQYDQNNFLNRLHSDPVNKMYIQKLFHAYTLRQFLDMLHVAQKSIIKFISLYDKTFDTFDYYLSMTKQTYVNDLILYRGFNSYFTHKLLIDVDHQIASKNKYIVIPSILSTSIYRRTAEKFMDGDLKILWCIRIHPQDFKTFKYSFVESSEIIIDPTTTADTNITVEAEFIINYGVILQFDKHITEQNREGTDIHIYYFTFVGYDSESVRRLNKTLPIYIENISRTIEAQY